MRTGSFWYNHFSTIGIIGMNEAMLNFLGKDITTPEGQEFAIEIMHFLREVMIEFQKETGNFYNLEATPAEGASYRLARLDKQRYPDIIAAGNGVSYYTNSSQLPVGFTDDIFECLELQDELQSLYTGGTVQHLYLGESISEVSVCKNLIKRYLSSIRCPISLTPHSPYATPMATFPGAFHMSRMRRYNRGMVESNRLFEASCQLQQG